MGIVIGILGGLLVVILLCLLAAVLSKPTLQSQEVDSTTGQEQAIIFNLENIKAATRSFHDDNKLGQGGFGTVYKGTMPDGKQIAVKKLSVQSLQGKKEFLNEVKLVAKIQHRNLVNLLGCCAQGSERLLVYEFLPNKSLDKILFHPERSKELNWHRRLNIILGVARGLLYLHEDSQLPIIHRDIKASNILLDENLEPKISDFGLARLFRRDETHVSTRVAGTFGYMAPEYAMLGQLSIKADVYSFGVVILEIISGKKNTNIDLSPDFGSLLEWVWRSYMGGNIVDVIDRSIIESVPNDEVSRCIHVGLLCAQTNTSLRPSMTSVYAMLLNLSVTNLPNPINPTFLNLTQKDDSSHTSASTSTSTSTVGSTTSSTLYPSINDASVTDFGAR
ncbi:cysteine-rich receptor-like protein kinase 43 [Cryptomeria japonica]|uniref:cysteine-rich receptor-like protein kinase 43 n=1 Tax=Cryptomeria japonica TaxID=3369 RepID=UPI0025AD923D|nr:cysteine-rich receptor-like protein kinase 43 [Cryptomeria japonica]